MRSVSAHEPISLQPQKAGVQFHQPLITAEAALNSGSPKQTTYS
jgi:hypothetical protein